MRNTWNRVESWLALNLPEDLHHGLQPGATNEEIQQAEVALGIVLPEDVKASYQIHNGQCGSFGVLINGLCFYRWNKYYTAINICETSLMKVGLAIKLLFIRGEMLSQIGGIINGFR